MQIKLMPGSIVLLVGPSNSGKTTLLKQLVEKGEILTSEIISSDAFRNLVADDDFIDLANVPKQDEDIIFEQYKRINDSTFHVLHTVVKERAKLNKISFIDATNLRKSEREKYIEIARENHVPIVALVFNTSKAELLSRDALRENPRGKKRILKQYETFRYEKKSIKKEPFDRVYILKDADLEIVRKNNPLFLEIGQGFDIIGDIHGCFDELLILLNKLGYEKQGELYVHPEGRRLISVGDIMSRGPKSLETMLFWQKHIEAGLAYMTDSNHGWKIARFLDGKDVKLSHGDELVQKELEEYAKTHGDNAANELKNSLKDMLYNSPSHYVLSKNGLPKVIVTHAGIKDHYIGKQSKRISDFCRYGDAEMTNTNSRPIRKDWFMDHKRSELIIWGHDVKVRPFKANRTINIDQGVVFGGELTAFRYPEETFVSVKAIKNYAGDNENPILEAKEKRMNPPNVKHYVNGFTVFTEKDDEIYIPKEQALTALDAFSHVTMPIEQVVYIPPTMSPTPQPSQLPDFLEHPQEAFDYYKKNGVSKMIAEKKHMGSRAILFIAQNEMEAEKIIGTRTLGYIYTRTGRPFFEKDKEKEMVTRIHAELLAKNYFGRFDTSFVLMDAEILPWNLKAESLIDAQYRTVAENALMDRAHLVEKLANTNGLDVSEWLEDYKRKLENAKLYEKAFNNYIWSVENLKDVQIAPFHILAHSGKAFFDKPHTWHMEMNALLAENSDIFIATEYRLIENEEDEKDVIDWWLEMTEDGHEGIVIKPLSFLAYNKGKLLQPAIKVRGREYLRIIYGMDYTDEENITRLKKRSTSRKMKNAILEFKLGMEGINRFVNFESMARVHECALATLALESDKIDPRL